MKLFKRKNYLTLHLYISLFFIPMALIYKITGIVCILGYFGDNKVQEISLNDTQKATLQSIIESSLAQNTKDSKNIESNSEKGAQNGNLNTEILKNNFIKFLIDNKIELPTSTSFQKSRRKNAYELGSSAQKIELEMSNPPKITMYKNDWLGNLIALHFARAGAAFNTLAFSFVIFMFITYLTGLLLCDFKRNGKKYFIAILIGFITTTALALHGLYFW